MNNPHDSLPLKSALSELYLAIGQEAGLHKILRAFYKKMSTDILLNHFFFNRDLEAIIVHQKEFLMRAMGASPSYAGKTPAQAHSHLPPILEGHFDRRMLLLEQTLQEFSIPPHHAQMWISFEKKFKDFIVKDADSTDMS